MDKAKKLKDSYSLYRNSPVYWMFMPYYVATVAKKEYASEAIERELKKDFWEVNDYELNKHIKARDFNEELLCEMEEEARQHGIENLETLMNELFYATESVLKKHGLEKYIVKKEE